MVKRRIPEIKGAAEVPGYFNLVSLISRQADIAE